MVRLLASVSAEYPTAGVAELRHAGGDGATVRQLELDLVMIDGERVRIADLARRAAGTDLVFCKHLVSSAGSIEADELTDVTTAARCAARMLNAAGAARVDGFALQAWAVGEPDLPFTPGGLAAAVSRRFDADGRRISPAGHAWTASLILCGQNVHVGWTRTTESISDWPGGRMRLARRHGQVSRAEFKLEELFKTAPIRLPVRGQALDLGASPGGWTRVLRARGLDVTAVDPGDLAPALVRDRRIRHVRTTARPFLKGQHGTYDVIVNDMRMEPEQSVRTMLEAANCLARNGVMVMTLKLGPVKNPTPVVRRSLAELAAGYDVTFARQLHHNRHEVTVVARPRPRTRSHPGRARAARINRGRALDHGRPSR